MDCAKLFLGVSSFLLFFFLVMSLSILQEMKTIDYALLCSSGGAQHITCVI